MNLKFYMTPGSCSTGIHILLEELELVFEVYLVNLLKKDNLQADYLSINPKGSIPTLVTVSGQSITDFQSIAWWLANSYPKKQFLPESLIEQVHVLEVMNYAVNTIHGDGFTRIFTTDKYSLNPAEHDNIKKQGKEIIDKGFKVMEQYLQKKEYVCGQFSIADAALFYVEFWADKIDISLPENCLRHYQQMLNRSSVQQVLREEGYGAML